jgi:electron transport complex protein RnfD
VDHRRFGVLGEAFCLRLAGKKPVIPVLDGSALLTGWLLALSLPPWAPWWIGVIGGLFATVIGKQVFGGLGQNLFNPAMVARVMPADFLPGADDPVDSTAAAALGQRAGLHRRAAHHPRHGCRQRSMRSSSATLLGYAKTELSRGIDLLQSLAATQARRSVCWAATRRQPGRNRVAC